MNNVNGNDLPQRELARETFVLATARLEEAHVITLAGQSAQLTGKDCAQYAQELRHLAKDMAAIAAFLHCLSQRETTHG